MKLLLDPLLEWLVAISLAPYLAYGILYALFGRTTTKQKKPTITYQPAVSVVIAAYNEEQQISEKLANTVAIDYPPMKLDIIVVDASTDNTPEIVREWIKKDSRIRLVKEDRRRGLASALNLAYSMASSEIVIKSDCDIMLPPDAVSRMVSNFALPEVGAVSGKQLLLDESRHERGYRSLIDVKRLVENRIDSIYLLEPFSGFRKALIERIDEKSVADDAELGLKIRKKGYKVLFDPTAQFYERLPLRFMERLRIKQRRAQGHIKLMLSNLDVLFNSRYGNYGMLVFPLNFFLIAIAPWILAMILLLLPLSSYVAFESAGIMSVGILYLAGAILYVSGKPNVLAGFIDSQLALIVGSLLLAIRGPSYMWRR